MAVDRTAPRRRIDAASLALTFVGLVFGVFAYWLIATASVNVLIIAPSIVAVTVGVTHLVKNEAPRQSRSTD